MQPRDKSIQNQATKAASTITTIGIVGIMAGASTLPFGIWNQFYQAGGCPSGITRAPRALFISSAYYVGISMNLYTRKAVFQTEAPDPTKENRLLPLIGLGVGLGVGDATFTNYTSVLRKQKAEQLRNPEYKVMQPKGWNIFDIWKIGFPARATINSSTILGLELSHYLHKKIDETGHFSPDSSTARLLGALGSSAVTSSLAVPLETIHTRQANAAKIQSDGTIKTISAPAVLKQLVDEKAFSKLYAKGYPSSMLLAGCLFYVIPTATKFAKDHVAPLAEDLARKLS